MSGTVEKERQKKNAYKKRALAAEKTLLAVWLAVEHYAERGVIDVVRSLIAESEARLPVPSSVSERTQP